MPLLADFRVLRYDGRGQGASSKPEGIYDLETLTADLLQVLDEWQWPASCFAGISNGGCVALNLAARHPLRVRALVAADCYHRVTPLLRLKIQSWLSANRLGGPAHRFEVAAPWIWSEAALASQPERLLHYRDKAVQHPAQAVEGLLQGALLHQIELAAISAPTLFLAGREDVLTPPSLLREMNRDLPTSRFLEVSGGHASLLETPSLMADPVASFFREAFGVV
jgi:3-oxoadipate enol-lactonase